MIQGGVVDPLGSCMVEQASASVRCVTFYIVCYLPRSPIHGAATLRMAGCSVVGRLRSRVAIRVPRSWIGALTSFGVVRSRRTSHDDLRTFRLGAERDQLQTADSVEKLVWLSGAGAAAKFDLIEWPPLNATRSGDGL